ncbi:YicC/YloC family endoribonuclease [Maritimibacter sp. 55A14]|uniref:YicC/YloC family endoribonuclease n=1 Tax=Maritimibacter sp. 55A14 TaxID=2174844 RepID=UPI001E63E802|nr:YicC/YloC family endoribonuclease [Maritimibacter sp. 55A14]
MTGFASASGTAEGLDWTWEMRGVNARGLDIRLRLPEGIPGLEPRVRAAVVERVARGNVTIGLRLRRAEGAAVGRLDSDRLAAALDALCTVRAEAERRGLALGPDTPASVLGLRGVFEPGGEADAELTPDMLAASLDTLLADFVAMRAEEGAALQRILIGQLDMVAELLTCAQDAAALRAEETEENFRAALARVTGNAEGVEPQRIAQELAVMAVKADVTEEFDRLDAHVAAARDLLGAGGPVGRRLDFLTQEFNREANTLCSKSGHEALTRIGLDLKAVIDQMREQVQNVE